MAGTFGSEAGVVELFGGPVDGQHRVVRTDQDVLTMWGYGGDDPDNPGLCKQVPYRYVRDADRPDRFVLEPDR